MTCSGTRLKAELPCRKQSNMNAFAISEQLDIKQIKMISILGIYLLSYSVFSSELSCALLLGKLVGETNQTKLLLEIMPYLGLSGKGNQQYGYYDACLRDENNRYSSLVMVPDKGSPLYYGMCHSKQCSTDDLNNQQINNGIKQFINATGIPQMIGIDIMNSQLYFIDPQTYYPEMGFGTTATVIIIAVLVIISFLDPLQRIIYAHKTSQKHHKKFLEIQGSQLSVSDDLFQVQNKDLDPPFKQTNGVLSDFSAYSNFKELCSMSTQDPNLAIFSGIRSLAFMMVLYGHTNQMMAGSAPQLELYIKMDSWMITWIFNMLYSVDIFFWLAGFFLGFVLADPKKSRILASGPVGVFMTILHRLLRIWPCYILAIMINSYLAPYWGEGPRWFSARTGFECPAGSWRNILFIDNWFKNGKEICFGWGWYLSTEFQLFLAAMIPMIIYGMGRRVISKVVIGCLLAGTQYASLHVSIHYRLFVLSKALFNKDSFYGFYVMPYCRGPPYFLGLLLGVLYREYKITKVRKTGISFFTQFERFLTSPGRRILFQLGFYGLGFGIIFWIYFGWKKAAEVDDYWSDIVEEFYHAFCRLLFVVGLSSISFVNMIGIKDIFNTTIMNCKFFRFVAKISFTAYLVHFIVILYTSATFFQAPEFSYRNNTQFFIGNFALSIVLAFQMSLFVELPFGKLQGRLLNGAKQSQTKKFDEGNQPGLKDPLL